MLNKQLKQGCMAMVKWKFVLSGAGRIVELQRYKAAAEKLNRRFDFGRPPGLFGSIEVSIDRKDGESEKDTADLFGSGFYLGIL
jgi:hypothetical protein